MKRIFMRTIQGMSCLCLLFSLMGASCVKNPDGSYKVVVGDLSTLLKDKQKGATGAVVNEDGTITLEGCWFGAGSAADSESGFRTPDYDWFPTYELAKTDAQRDELISACVHYRPDDRCCRVTLEGSVNNGEYKIRRFIKAEQIQ